MDQSMAHATVVRWRGEGIAFGCPALRPNPADSDRASSAKSMAGSLFGFLIQNLDPDDSDEEDAV